MLAVLGLLTVSGGEAPYRSVVVGPVNGMLEGNTLSIEALSVGQAYIVVSDAYDQTDLVSITVIESGLSQLDSVPLTSENEEINDAGVGGSITGGVTADNGVTLFSNGSFSAGEMIKVVMTINPPAAHVGELAGASLFASASEQFSERRAVIQFQSNSSFSSDIEKTVKPKT